MTTARDTLIDLWAANDDERAALNRLLDAIEAEARADALAQAATNVCLLSVYDIPTGTYVDRLDVLGILTEPTA